MLQTLLVMSVAEVVTEMLDAPPLSRILKLAVAKLRANFR